MTIFELMQSLSAFDADSADMAAKATVQSGIAGAKEVYMAWGKSIGVTARELEAAYKEAQPAKSNGGPNGFTDTYYNWLAEESRTEQEAHDYIMAPDTSNNTKAHLTHFLNIWALAETVRSGQKVVRTISAGKASPKPNGGASAKEEKEPKDAWEYNDADPFTDVRSAWENLKRETAKAKPRKSRLHPDKVAKLEDADLSAAYTKALQVYGK